MVLLDRRAGRRWRSALWIAVACSSIGGSGAQDEEDNRHRLQLTQLVAERQDAILAELMDLLAIPNVASDADGIRRNADHLTRRLEARGFTVRVLLSGGRPYLLAHLPAEAGPRPAPVVLFYTHYDGQPVDPSRWTVTGPFTPKLMGSPDDPEARLYARSASDDKAPIVALLNALDLLRAAGLPPTVEIRWLLDPEEEAGSPNLAPVLQQHRDALVADLMIFADGPVHPSGRPTIAFGVRGIVTARLTMYGPEHAVHSGHYGNWAPNPAEKLSFLLASMKDADGRVLVEGFYDDVVPLSPLEREMLGLVPAVEEALQEELLVALPDGAGRSLQEMINLPSLNVRGLASGWTGDEARTIVPSTAVAELDLRLVKGIDPARQVERLRAHARRLGYHVVDHEPAAATRRAHPNVLWIESGGGVPATRTPMDTAWSARVIDAVARASSDEPVLLPTLGGTVPLHAFEAGLGLPVYGVPIVNPDNNQHAPDENIRLGNLWDGIVTYASLMRMTVPR